MTRRLNREALIQSFTKRCCLGAQQPRQRQRQTAKSDQHRDSDEARSFSSK